MRKTKHQSRSPFSFAKEYWDDERRLVTENRLWVRRFFMPSTGLQVPRDDGFRPRV